MENTKVQVKSRLEILKGFHNKHMTDALANLINVKLCESVDPKEIVASIPMNIPGSPQPIIKNVTAKQQLESSTHKYNSTTDLLMVIEKLMEDEGYEFNIRSDKSVKGLPILKVDKVEPKVKPDQEPNKG